MAKIAKTADRKKIMDTTKSTDCPKCGKPTRVVKRVKDREKRHPGWHVHLVLGMRVLREAINNEAAVLIPRRTCAPALSAGAAKGAYHKWHCNRLILAGCASVASISPLICRIANCFHSSSHTLRFFM